MSAKDRVKTASEATAASVRQIRPLTLPENCEASAGLGERQGRNVPRVGRTLTRIRETWIIPLGAAAAVAALALALVVVRHEEGQRPALANSGTVAPTTIAGIPRYYAIATMGPVSHAGMAVIDVTVGDDRTGGTLATVALPAVSAMAGVNSAVGVSAAADDRTFVVGRRDSWGDVGYFLVRIAPGTKHVATVEPVPIPPVQLGALLGFAVSPDGKELAVLSVRGNGTTLRTYSVKTGANLRTWIAGTWKYQGGGIPQTGVSWTADSRQVAFSTALGSNTYSGVLEERLISATAPSGDLAAASKVRPQGAGQLHVAPPHTGRRDRCLCHADSRLPGHLTIRIPSANQSDRLREERADARRLLCRHRQAVARPVPVHGGL